MATTVTSEKLISLEHEGLEKQLLRLLPKYLKSKPLSLLKALEECGSQRGERGQEFIYKKFYGYLMAIALRYIKDEMGAEDVVNESFVKVFRKITEFTYSQDELVVEKLFKAWIARITVNTAIDKLRVQKELLSLDDLSTHDLSSQSVMITTRLEEQDILSLINQLPDMQRSIFNLYEVEGYSHAEIGKLLDIPESTSRTYLTRAKVKLRSLYTLQTTELKTINHS